MLFTADKYLHRPCYYTAVKYYHRQRRLCPCIYIAKLPSPYIMARQIKGKESRNYVTPTKNTFIFAVEYFGVPVITTRCPERNFFKHHERSYGQLAVAIRRRSI